METKLEAFISPARELGFLLVHGLLHLLGYDHEQPDDERVMLAEQERILTVLHLTRDAPAEGGA